MYEEDRVRALELYGEIFDEIGNDTAVLQLLVSPTRQAVNLARAYDAKDRGAQSPAFLRVIDEIRSQAGSLLPETPKVDDGQLSLFNEPERTENTENLFDSLDFDFPADEAKEEAKEELSEELPEELPEDLSDGLNRFPDEDRAEGPVPVSPAPAPAPAPVPAPAPAPAAQPEEVGEKTPEEELDNFADSVASFLADFDVDDSKDREEPPAAPVQSAAKDAASFQELPPKPVREEVHPDWGFPAKQDAAAKQKELFLPNVPEETNKVPIVGLLVLFIVLAIPVGLALVGLLLIPAALCLCLAAVSLSVGFYGFVAAFTAFGVFADILLVFGLSLALVALGLLFLWAFVWLLASVIPSLIRAICGFVRKHCYKEVTI